MPIVPISDQIVARVTSITSGGGVELITDSTIPIIVAQVTDVGPGKYDNGAYTPLEISVDDYVVIGSYAGTPITINSSEHRILTKNDVKAKFTNS